MRFYAYRAYGDIHRASVTHSHDRMTGDPPQPAGTVIAFASRREREDYVNGEFDVTTRYGTTNYHALSAIDAKTARKLVPCYSTAETSCHEDSSCATHGPLKSEMDKMEALLLSAT